MPDIFISYSREDRPIAGKVAEALKAGGFDVWWDAVLRAGESYDEITEEKLRNAGAVVVLWSRTSSKSKWVRAEATIGERYSTLVPAIIQDCDRPLRFELIQTADLTQWDGNADDPNWLALVADIKSVLREDHSSVTRKLPTPTMEAAKSDNGNKAAPAYADDTIETVFWSTIKDTTDPSELEAYLKRYKHGHFVDIAQSRLAAISGAEKPASAENVTQPAASGIPQQLIAMGIFMVAAMIGMAMLVIANSIHIGWFTWAPIAGAERLTTGVKEIGFFSAINWSITALILMPVAWTLIFFGLSEAREIGPELVRRRMLVTPDFAPITLAHSGYKSLIKHIRLFVFGGVIAVTVLSVTLSLTDHAQVAGRFYDNTEESARLDRLDGSGYALEAPDVERDWMVASLLSTPKSDKANANYNGVYSLAAYIIYVGMGIGSLLSFGLIMIGVSAIFMRGIAQYYGIQIIPSLQSKNPRGGFEVIRRFFGIAYAVAFIGCVLCYLMGIQNLYLRSPHENIFAFLSPDIMAFENAVNWRAKLDAIIGFLFAENVGKGTRNVYVWVFGFFIFAVFIGGFMFFFRQGALIGKSLIAAEIAANGEERLKKLTPGDLEPVLENLKGLHLWPLDRPSLQHSLLIVGLFVVSFIFYKAGAIILLGLCSFLVDIYIDQPVQLNTDPRSQNELRFIPAL